MSLYVYEGISYMPWGYKGHPLEVIEFDRPFIHDVESLFEKYGITDIEITKKILKKIEKGEFVDKHTFCDRFGRFLDIKELSTSSKALLVLAACRDKVLNFSCVGGLAQEMALSWFKEGYIYMDSICYGIRYDVDLDIVVNERRHYTKGNEFNAEWCF